GDLLVYQVGTGGTQYGSTGSGGSTSGVSAGIYLVEYSPAGVPIQTIAVPTTVSSSLTATTEGQISLSADGHSVSFAGYQAAAGIANIASTDTSTTPRVLGIVSAAGVVDVSTTTTAYNQGNLRDVVSVDGKEFYTAGVANARGTDGAFHDSV